VTEERAESGGEGQVDRRLHLRLVDAGDLIFDRVLDRHDLALGVVERGECRGERRGFTAAGRAGDHDQAVRLRQLLGFIAQNGFEFVFT